MSNKPTMGWICPQCNMSVSPYVETCNCKTNQVNNVNEIVADEINRTKGILKLKGVYEGLSSVYNPKARSRIQKQIGNEMSKILKRLEILEKK